MSSLKHQKHIQIYVTIIMINYFQLFRFEKGNIIGDEDLIAGMTTYRTTCKCISLTGLVARMRREDFMRLENQPYSWTALSISAKTKEASINKLLVLKNKVQSTVQITSKQVEVQMIEEAKIREKKAQENNKTISTD